MGLETLALLASAAGTGTQIYAQNQANNRAENAAQAELVRQKGFQKSANQAFQDSAAQSIAPVAQQQMDAGAARANQQYAQLAGIPLSAAAPGGEGGPNEQLQQKAQAGGLAQAAQSRAKLQGYSSWDLDQWIKNLRAMQQQQMYGTFARGSAQVLPLELQAAQHSQDSTKMLGQGLSMAGMLGGLYTGGLGAAGGLSGSVTSDPSYYNSLGWRTAATGGPSGGWDWSALKY